MPYYHNSDEIAHDVLTTGPVRNRPKIAHDVLTEERYGYGTGERSAGKIAMDAGLSFATTDLAVIVEAAHKSGAVCLIAHPGRGDGFTLFDDDMLDQLRRQVPIDGLEAHYPAHTPEQISMYRAYAQKHGLLISSGSDSHGPNKMPTKYRAELCRSLLEYVGIQIK